MGIKTLENLSTVDCIARTIAGIILSMSVLFLPLGTMGIAAVCLVAAYPLLTGLVAIDPIIALFSATKNAIAFHGKEARPA